MSKAVIEQVLKFTQDRTPTIYTIVRDDQPSSLREDRFVERMMRTDQQWSSNRVTRSELYRSAHRAVRNSLVETAVVFGVPEIVSHVDHLAEHLCVQMTDELKRMIEKAAEIYHEQRGGL